MALEELKRDLTEAEADVRSYLENSEEYAKLKIFKVLMELVTIFAQTLLIGALALLALVLLSWAASNALNEALESAYLGYLLIGMSYVLIAVICYFLRNRLNGPVLRTFSKHYFD
ncbi:hypothetical protein GQ41_1760 [Arenibacter algicola]|jgi:hypothetical protein|uniref:Competence protein n=1 Tax=Arenibacter algicola TaxID=616991 RepID=A0A221V051_9FLAO|nr:MULTISPECIES: hypothetical protein [Arenibacter]ASO06972.1 competence protein [Arenibacter algicola]GBF20239.1 hypothetical protein C21_02410 [Arenibacter sp. NBRC 103722]HCO84897.1 hypothetical protein [Arenibacter sp.]|tara:strand:- start:40101 stop:40445 length:345 start_codon:yes stop_codon:yes gene_type:complete